MQKYSKTIKKHTITEHVLSAVSFNRQYPGYNIASDKFLLPLLINGKCDEHHILLKASVNKSLAMHINFTEQHNKMRVVFLQRQVHNQTPLCEPINE